jgi:glutaminyl-peptide cyclotransferase
MKRFLLFTLSIFLLAACTPAPATVTATNSPAVPSPTPNIPHFDGQRALQDVFTLESFGARVPGSQAHAQAVAWIATQLTESGWRVEIQETERMGHPIRNIYAQRDEKSPVILIGSHYDSRMFADADPNPANHTLPVPGANDGGSSTAILLELARTLPQDGVPVGLVFFDAEDQGRIEGWDWILGSRAFVETMTFTPETFILLDLVGEPGARFTLEQNSTPALAASLWAQAAALGYDDYFVNEPGWYILDDHIPFLERGIPSVDVIDLDYPYWHTVEDTADKLSAETMQAVGETVLAWVRNYGR